MVASTLPELFTMAAPGASHAMLTLTKLDMTTTERAFEQGKQAYGLQNYSQAVDFYTHALELLRSELESVILLHRASAYEMLSKYDRAAEDAKQANPNNDLIRPDPYLVRANTLLLQRRWHEATNIYKRGAIIVSNTYRQRALLVDKYQQLTTFTQKYNQWIAETLPYEVVSQILSYMSTTDRVQLASTCNFWRNFIHQQQGASSLWHTIHISEMASSSNPENIGPLLYSVALDKPKAITLYRSDKDDMAILHKVSQKILGIANDRRWDKLEILGR
ncbi:hypothetical protein BDC45DRAFT_150162 [Circinella umbellata]|nr:hypothetical protein BDC45DRAFT_150162 [Circinella umbellata]